MTLYITGSSFLKFTFLRKDTIGKGWMHRWMGKGFLLSFQKSAYVTYMCLRSRGVLGAVGVAAPGSRVWERLGPEWLQKTLNLRQWVPGKSLRVWHLGRSIKDGFDPHMFSHSLSVTSRDSCQLPWLLLWKGQLLFILLFCSEEVRFDLVAPEIVKPLRETEDLI